jgi:hypothetical protein
MKSPKTSLATHIMSIYRIISSVFLLAVIAGLTGCGETPREALSGYNVDWTGAHYGDHPLNKAITDDVQSFIRSKKIPQSDISEIIYGEDSTGRHAAMIMQEIPASQGKETTEYILYYDSNNTRTNVRTFHSTRSC